MFSFFCSEQSFSSVSVPWNPHQRSARCLCESLCHFASTDTQKVKSASNKKAVEEQPAEYFQSLPSFPPVFYIPSFVFLPASTFNRSNRG